ncbi:type VII secretion system-associated protein [Streptomyces sp. ALB3]|uniref:type VII secretion system-associated protein n=1 Tax=Streptomyces sp. ALB3 TaxID=3374278 RepID=UPI00378910BF
MYPGERQEGQDAASFAMPEASGPALGSAAPGPDSNGGAPPSGIPEAVKAAGRRAPGHWIGVVDPEWTEERTPPEWAVLGEWRSEESGDLGEYRANPAYRPSARVLGWPEPTDPVDAAAQRAATGYGSVEAALAALAEAEVSVVRAPDGGPLTAAGRDGAPVILVFTSPAHEFMSAALRHDTVAGRELARSPGGPGTMLMVNAGAAAPLFVPADSLRGPERAAGGAAEPAAGASVSAAGATAEEGPLAPVGAVRPTGLDAAEPSARRTDSPSGPWPPHTTGRTP